MRITCNLISLTAILKNHLFKISYLTALILLLVACGSGESDTDGATTCKILHSTWTNIKDSNITIDGASIALGVTVLYSGYLDEARTKLCYWFELAQGDENGGTFTVWSDTSQSHPDCDNIQDFYGEHTYEKSCDTLTVCPEYTTTCETYR